jgi:hypothetical protein
MANKPKYKTKPHPDFLGPTGNPPPEHPMCQCTIYDRWGEATAQLDAIVKEIDRMMMETLKVADMTEYYEALEGHNERRH